MSPPTAILEALESGTITEAQIRELIAFEARELGMSYDEAVAKVRDGSLPASPLGTDIAFLVDLLAA